MHLVADEVLLLGSELGLLSVNSQWNLDLLELTESLALVLDAHVISFGAASSTEVLTSIEEADLVITVAVGCLFLEVSKVLNDEFRC